jgi:hypothetical protein
LEGKKIPGNTGALAPTEAALKSEAEYKEYLVLTFDIPKHLLRENSEGGPHVNYRKYKACLKALSVAESMTAAGEWGDVRRPSETEIVELFIGKTMWHSHFKRIFGRVPQYPQLQKWLNEDEDGPSTIDIFGEEKSSIKFKDLKDWMDTEDRRIHEKGKGKEKVENKKGRKGEDSKDSGDSDKDKKRRKKKKSKSKEEGSSKKHHTRSKGKA